MLQKTLIENIIVKTQIKVLLWKTQVKVKEVVKNNLEIIMSFCKNDFYLLCRTINKKKEKQVSKNNIKCTFR